MTQQNPATRALLERGFQRLQAGDMTAAERCGREALQQSPRDAAAINVVAVALLGQGRHAEAVRYFLDLVELEPRQPSHWMNLGTAQRALGQLDDSLRAYERALALGERSPDLLYNVGLLQIDRGAYEPARLALREAYAANPNDAETSYYYASACAETLATHDGLAALEHWERCTGLTDELVAKIGALLMTLGDAEGAQRALDRALAAASSPPEATLQLVLALERMNRVDEADVLLARLQDVPASVLGSDLLLARARLAQRAAQHDQAVALYRQLIAGCPEPERRHFHGFPLAKSLDALGRYDEAFIELEQAHASQAAWIERTMPAVVLHKSDTMRVTRFGCDPQDVGQWDPTGAPSTQASPVFIVAFPRSGTTLLEQTLDAHPRLRSMDEQPYLQNAIERLAGPGVSYPDRMAALTRSQLEEARSYYWSLVARRVELQPGEQLLDKNPLNILRLPAITRLFPNARVILAIRHPCDVLLSCFMQHFRPEFAWHCRNIPTLALAYRRSLDFWYQQAALLQPASREVRYEAFVTDFEAGVRQLADFLELPWTNAMLAPGEHALGKGFISTPSYAQVLQPVHARSVGRWRSYAPHLAPATNELRPYLERWGYEVPS